MKQTSSRENVLTLYYFKSMTRVNVGRCLVMVCRSLIARFIFTSSHPSSLAVSHLKQKSHILLHSRSQIHHNIIYRMSLTNASPAEAARSAKSASHILATLPTIARNDALTAIHTALSEAKDEILAANARDLDLAKKAAENGELSLSIVSRLDLGKKGKFEDMLKGILDVRKLDDPGWYSDHA